MCVCVCVCVWHQYFDILEKEGKKRGILKVGKIEVGNFERKKERKKEKEEILTDKKTQCFKGKKTDKEILKKRNILKEEQEKKKTDFEGKKRDTLMERKGTF